MKSPSLHRENGPHHQRLWGNTSSHMGHEFSKQLTNFNCLLPQTECR